MNRYCFVIMPFTVRDGDLAKYENDKNHWGEVYEGLIQPAVEKAGFICERDDEDYSSRLIAENIWNKIEKAEIVLCDLSANNPNVFLELGWALRADKKFILIKDYLTPFPFDLNQFFTFEYSSRLQPTSLRKDIENLTRVIESTALGNSKPYSIVKKLSLEIEKVIEASVGMRVVTPAELKQEHIKARQDAQYWHFTGGTGTFTKTDTLPELDKQSSKTGKQINVKLLIIDPEDIKLCTTYSKSRTDKRRDDPDNKKWTLDYVRNQSYATIVLASLLSANNIFFRAEVRLKNHYSIFRADITQSIAIITKENQEEQIVRYNFDSDGYKSYSSDFNTIFDISKPAFNSEKHCIACTPSQLNEDKIKEILYSLNLGSNLSSAHLTEILHLLKHPISSYD